ncbi:MAG: hypothetical protein NTU63_00090 [Candidatus Pacearchaeota archaeon]|nr:hypothetical protein [Candidatus Pacearchaeota archaeon]
MRKIFLLLVVALLIFPLISALNLKIEQVSSDEAMIFGLESPVIFHLKITNLGSTDDLMFYTFFGADIYPKGTIPIGAGETKEVEVGVYPRPDFNQIGRIKFDIFIKGGDGSEMTYPLMVNAIKLGEAFEIGAEEFKPDSNTISVYVDNNVNFNFKQITAKFKSPFFNLEKTFDLPSYQKQSFEINLNKEDFRELMAGYYTLKVEISAEEEKTDLEGVIKFSEKDIVTTSQDEYGFVIHTKKITKSNEGNVISESSTILKKNIVSRLFTTFSPEPSIVERKGLSVYYTWEKEIKPGERLEIVVRTNWLLPLLAILLIVAIVILARQFSRTNLVLKKRVSFVRAKGGEFALKVSIMVGARKFVERVSVIDRLPPLVKLHERFGGETPRKVDEINRRVEWHFDKLEAGETRVISYIIYSRVGVVGKFALPTTTALYEREGEIHEVESNRAYFIAEQSGKQVED